MADDVRERAILSGVPPRLQRQWAEFLRQTGPRNKDEEVMLTIHATTFFRYLQDPVNGKGVLPDGLSLAMLGEADAVNDYLHFLDVQVAGIHHAAQGVLPALSDQVAHFLAGKNHG